MDNSKITIEFDMSHIDRGDKFRLIENYIRDFLTQYFLSFEMEKDIRIILADGVGNTKRRITGNKNDDIDNSMASLIYLDGQFIMVLPIGGFRSEIFPEEAKSYSKEFLENVRLTTNYLIYHEMQHIKNRYDYPALAQILDNALVISDSHTCFKLSACRFIDEYLATANSQNLFRTETDDKVLKEFEELHRKMSRKFSEKKLMHEDVYKIAYFYSHVFAINKIKIMENADELTPKIEDKLDGIGKRFFININNAIKKYSDKNMDLLIVEITRLMGDFYRLGSNSKNISSSP